MAIVKHIKSRNANYSAAINYLLFEHDEKTGKKIVDESGRSILRKEFYMDGLNCDPMSFDKECELTNAHFHKNKKREDIKSHHYIISYDPADVTENGLTGERAQAISSEIIPATEEDWGTEYLDAIISVKIVSSLEEAIAHINKYNTRHSEAILTNNKENAEKFLNEVDAACVYLNASTRFTDGFEFGLGAEIGISTQKLHARGPLGLKEMCSYQYKIEGNGQVRE